METRTHPSLTDAALLFPRDVHGEVRHLGPDAGQRAQPGHVRRYVVVVVAPQDLCGALQVHGLALKKIEEGKGIGINSNCRC